MQDRASCCLHQRAKWTSAFIVGEVSGILLRSANWKDSKGQTERCLEVGGTVMQCLTLLTSPVNWEN